jgi:hypothetical protein
MANWTASLPGGAVTVSTEKLQAFRDLYIDDPDLAARMAELFLLDLYVMDYAFGIGPHEVLVSIKELEAGERPTGVKPATPFMYPPLKGLWHKHFFAAHFLVDNIILGLGKKGLEKLVEQVMDPKLSTTVTEEMVNELARRVTHEPVEARDAAGKLTGEWIIFARRGGKNYYLAINSHTAGDQTIYDRIVQNTARDFPDIARWIAEAAQDSRQS